MDVGVSQHITLVLSLGSLRIGQPASSLSLHHQNELSSIALTNSPLVKSKGGAISPAFMPSMLVLPHLYIQGQHYCVAQVRYRGCYLQGCS